MPVLGAQPITKRWEQILDDEDSQGAPTTWVQDEPGTGPGSMYDYDELELDVARGVAGKPYPREDAFAFRERNWDGWKRSRKSVVVLLSLVMMFTVATIGALLAGAYIQQATRHISIAAPVPTTGNFSGGLVIQPARETPVPTPEAPKYQIGVWMSNNAPSGGVVKVFVRVSQDVKPIARIPVKLAVQIPGATLHYGPTKTDSYGLATFNVRFGGVAGSPCFVTASAKIGKSEYTADTVFVPI